jgi:hypothetical protein
MTVNKLSAKQKVYERQSTFNPLNTKLNPICHFLALLGAHPILYVSRIRVKSPFKVSWDGQLIQL